jgi:hypothetical protein
VDVVRIMAGHLLRRGWRATVFLALFAGLAAGVVMAAWAAGRRTSTAFDRFVELAAPPDLVVTLCPPDFVEVGPEELVECFAYDAASEVGVIRALPEVEDAGRVAFRGLVARSIGDRSRETLGYGVIVRDGGLVSPQGRPLLIDGRWFDPARADEIVVNEDFVAASGARIGDELEVAFWSSDELGRMPTASAPLRGPTARVSVVGVVRGLLDLAVRSPAADPFEQGAIVGGPLLYEVTPAAGQFGGIAVRARNGDVDATTAALERAFPDRPMNVGPALGADELEPIRETLEYEARGAEAFAAVAAVAAALFTVQAIGRRSRHEWSSLPTLRALGVDARSARATACVRGAVTGVAAGFVGAVTAVVLSQFTPIGNARRAEVDPGWRRTGSSSGSDRSRPLLSSSPRQHWRFTHPSAW